MTIPTKTNLVIYQGSTFTKTIRWESATKAYRTITGITKAAPMVVTSVSHGMLAGWRGKISNVSGMTEANELGYIVATTVDSNSLNFNSINAAGFKTYTGGGVLEYNIPVDLAGYTARMQIREKINSTTSLLELTTENLGITLNNTDKTIYIEIEDTVTSTLAFKAAVYSLEVVSPLDIVTTLIYGNVSLNKEVTR